jgi:fumarylacetoacetate (FAA) hydrolase
MKLATHADGSRDGHLVLVSDDLALVHPAQGRCTRLQQLLDDWNFLSPQLQDLAQALNHGKARHAVPFDASLCLPPLPRSYRSVQVEDGAATETVAVAAVRALGACDSARRLQPWLALVSGDVNAGADAAQAQEAIRLVGCVMQAEDVPSGEGPADVAPPRAQHVWAPVLVTPEQLGAGAWTRATGLQLHVQALTAAGNATGKARVLHLDLRPASHAVATAAQAHPLPAGSVVLVALQPRADHGGDADASPADPAASWQLEAGQAIRVTTTGPHGEDLFGAIRIG